MTKLKTDDNYDVAAFFQKQFIEANEVSHDGAGANGDRESRFRGTDELERYFNETGLDVFKDFYAAWFSGPDPLLSESTNVISR